MIVDPINSSKLGHSIFKSSAFTWLKKSVIFLIELLNGDLFFYFLYPYLAGQEGFEPPTRRFGVCRSTVRATGLYCLLSFFMHLMLTATSTMLLKL
jgi:hypothetical protein